MKELWRRYTVDTPDKLKIVDAYLLYILLTGIAQFVYCCLVGTFPFNSFLSGFISTVGCFVLGGASRLGTLSSTCNSRPLSFPTAVCLRLQANEENRTLFKGVTPEKAFADFLFCHVVLHLVVVNFIG